ncbi:MAG: hypothetical protein JKY09_06735 [Crocinitomicaceae bacterium]|nr:hypothetical protein [Crocinitomicaceae bacterium]
MTKKTDTFWYTDGKGKTQINYTQLYRFLNNKGIWQVNLSDSWFKVEIINKIITEVDDTYISQLIMKHIRELDEDSLEKDKIEEALRKCHSAIVSKNQLKLLDTKEITFKKDTKEECNLYYTNQWLDIKADKVDGYDFSYLDDNVWSKKKLGRNINLLDSTRAELLKDCEFAQFLWNISNKDQQRYDGVCSMLGYLIHEFKDPKTVKAVVFMDEKISDHPNGRTGKGIIRTALEKMKEVLVQDGKSFKHDQFCFQDVKHSTSILVFEDVPRKFDPEKLFSIQTDGLSVVRKGEGRFRIDKESAPKILINTNYVLRGEGGSNEARRCIFELSEHYSVKHTPYDEFGHNLFTEWDDKQWNLFDNFMIKCIQLFLEKGIMEVKGVNIEQKKITSITCSEFVEFIADYRPNKMYNRNELMRLFEEMNPELKSVSWFTNYKFCKWIRSYASHKGHEYKEERGNGKRTSDTWFGYFKDVDLNEEQQKEVDKVKLALLSATTEPEAEIVGDIETRDRLQDLKDKIKKKQVAA